jgi:CRISPR-associated exonuclease Cas4
MISGYTDDELLALSGIQHFAFCERQWALIHLERQWAENLSTTEGHILHEKVHDPNHTDSRDSVVFVRALSVVSYRLGLQGVVDLIEFHPIPPGCKSGMALSRYEGLYHPIPVEYKRGKEKPDDRDTVQLCAQALCLEEMYGVTIEQGFIFYGQTRRRIKVLFDQQLRSRVAELSEKMHGLFRAGVTPPARKGVKCNLCSMVDLCLPKITQKRKPVEKYLQEQLTAAKNSD